MDIPIALSAAIIIAALGFIATVLASHKKKLIDYYAFFLIGIVWVAAGSFFMIAGNFSLNSLYTMGLIFAIFGLVHRKDWEKHKARWHKLTEHEKKVRLVVVVALAVVVLIGVIFSLVIRANFG